MKKITAIIAVSAVAAVLAMTGCQKHETAPKPVEQSSMTSTATTTTPMAAPAQK